MGDTEGDEACEGACKGRGGTGSAFRRGDWFCPTVSCPTSVVMGRLTACGSCGAMISSGTLLTASEVAQHNRFGVSGARAVEEAAEPKASLRSSHVVWQYDGDEKGWLEFDQVSSELLESAFVQCCSATLPVVQLSCSGGVYTVDLNTMEQTNTQTYFMRLVRRMQC
jgi:hypothetical protein